VSLGEERKVEWTDEDQNKRFKIEISQDQNFSHVEEFFSDDNSFEVPEKFENGYLRIYAINASEKISSASQTVKLETMPILNAVWKTSVGIGITNSKLTQQTNPEVVQGNIYGLRGEFSFLKNNSKKILYTPSFIDLMPVKTIVDDVPKTSYEINLFFNPQYLKQYSLMAVGGGVAFARFFYFQDNNYTIGNFTLLAPSINFRQTWGQVTGAFTYSSINPASISYYKQDVIYDIINSTSHRYIKFTLERLENKNLNSLELMRYSVGGGINF
jgi:hypothetical protein